MMTHGDSLTVALALLLLAGVVVWLALRLRRSTGIPWVRIAASDTGGGTPLQEPLFSRRYGLTGKPDYLLEHGATWIPVEVKPGRTAPQPYESDLMQLVAYCLLVEEATGSPPPYGLLRYAYTSFRVAYTPTLREALLDVVDEMHIAFTMEECPRSHNNPRRCQACGFVEECEEALV